jgi:hypothetical protein
MKIAEPSVAPDWGGNVDYGAWVRRLEAFIEDRRSRSAPEDRDLFQIEVAPRLGRAELKELEESCGSRLPAPLRDFLSQGAASVAFQCVWPSVHHARYEVEVQFCPVEDLAEWRDECVEYARESWPAEPDWPLDYAFWRHGWPLIRYESSDCVALWCHDRDQPHYPIIYVDHEDTSHLLARTFDEFLEQWERLGYLDIGDLPRDPETGLIDATTPEARQLREELGLSS